MTSNSAHNTPPDYSKNLEIGRKGAEYDRPSIPLPDAGRARMNTVDEVLTILQYYVMVFVLGVEGHLPECHWTHNVLVYLPVCFSAFPYIFLCMYFTDVRDEKRVAKITSRIVDQSFANAFTFVAIKLGRNEACGSGVRLWNKFTAVVLFCGTCLVNYFRLKELADQVARVDQPSAKSSPDLDATEDVTYETEFD